MNKRENLREPNLKLLTMYFTLRTAYFVVDFLSMQKSLWLPGFTQLQCFKSIKSIRLMGLTL